MGFNSVFKGLKNELQVSPEHVDTLVSAVCLLHNLIIDKEGTDDATLQKIKSSDTTAVGASAIRRPSRYNRATWEVYNSRERFKIYFNGEGAVDFQYNQIDTYVEWNTLNDLSHRLSLFLIKILHRSAPVITNVKYSIAM